MRYLIVKTSAFGDIIHAYPVLEYIKEQDPTCEIDWVVEKRMKGLVEPHPLVSRVIEIDSKAWRKKPFSAATWREILAFKKELQRKSYDALFDLQGNVKSALITFLARAKTKVGCGFKTAHEMCASLSYTKRYNLPSNLNVRHECLYLVQSYFNRFIDPATSSLLAPDGPLPELSATWLIAPGSNWKNKQLTVDTLIAFLRLCSNKYHPTFAFLCGTEQEKAQAEELAALFANSTILYKPTLPVLQHIMSKMELVLSMDSLPLHLAGTIACPTFSFFGPSSSQKYNPLGVIHGAFQGSCPYGQTFDRRCKNLRSCPTGACLREVSADTLFKVFDNWYTTAKPLECDE